METLTNIVIEPQTIPIENEDTKQRRTQHLLSIYRKSATNRRRILWRYKDLHNTTDVQFIRREDDDNEHIIPLPKNLITRIGSYLREQERFNNMDCAEFVYFIHGLELNNHRHDKNLWEDEVPLSINEDNIKPGDTLVLRNQQNQITHMAIYLDDGLYLSKFGSKGNLSVTDLDSMKGINESHNAFRTKLKENNIP